MRRRAWIATTARPPASTAVASSFDRDSSNAVIGHLHCLGTSAHVIVALGVGARVAYTRGHSKTRHGDVWLYEPAPRLRFPLSWRLHEPSALPPDHQPN